MRSKTKPFVRDNFTWLAYFMLGYFAYLQAVLGPLMPYIKSELNISYTIASLHVSAFSLGMILAGSFGDKIVLRLGRRLVFWGGGSIMALGAIFLVLGRTATITIGSSLLMGFFGSLLLVIIQASLSDQHGERRVIALTEANTIGSLGAGFAPIFVGVFQHTAIGWQGAPLVAIAFLLLITMRWRFIEVPQIQTEISKKANELSRRLPLAFWVYWAALVCCVSIEWCIVVWGSDFLRKMGHLDGSLAAVTLGLFFVAEMIGRLIGSRITHIVSSVTMLLISLAITMIGFPIFWLSSITPLSIIGLFVAGLGIANLYPLTLSVASGVTPKRALAASARLSLGVGFAVFTAPLILGWVADSAGIQHAFGLVVLLLIGALAMTLIANHLPGLYIQKSSWELRRVHHKL